MSTQTNKKQAAPGVGPEAEARVDHKQQQSHYTTLPGLSQQHYAMLKASAISDEVIKERGYRTTIKAKDLQVLGFSSAQQRVPGLLLPLHTTDGQTPLDVYRPDFPRVIEDKKKRNPDGSFKQKVIKYEMPKGEKMRLDVPPRCRADIGDPSIPLWITEGQKKADALASIGLCAVALLGVWNFIGTNERGGKVFLSDWRDIALNNGRAVRIVFDSDVMTKPSVKQALEELTRILERKGAKVLSVNLPGGNNKIGVDDWLAEGHTVTDLENLCKGNSVKLDLLGDDIDDSDDRELFQVKRYEVINGAYHAIEYKENRGAEPILIQRALCNFDARILEEIAKDDGQDVTRVLKIKGQRAMREGLPEIEVDASDFSGMKWVMQKWGLKAIIYAGQSNADKLREAIQWHSQEAILRTEYTHTGWREIEGKRVYLTTAGALGLENINVRLEGGLKRYAIPTSLDGIDLQEAVKKSLQLLEIAPRSVTWALWGCMYLAPLADLAPIDFMLWVFAETGSLKSTLAAIFLSHYGNFTYKTLPEGWASTDNALEKSIFATKDAPIVIDDFAPQASGMEAQNYERRANRIIRAIGNHSPRTRMNADTSLREGYPSRGLVISTAEQLPSGQSILARVLPVEVLRDTVNRELLTTAQQEADYLPKAMAGYLLWLTAHWDAIKAEFQERITILRDEMRGDYHLRTPEMFANLLLGIKLGLTFSAESGAISEREAKALFINAKAEIKSLAELQSEHVRDELPTQRFIHVLESLIAQGAFYLKDMNENAEGTGKTWLGWFDNDYVYIQSETAYNAVSEFLRREGGAPLLKQKGLYSMLSRYELIMPAEDRTTATGFYKGRTYRVLRFYKNKVHFTKEKNDVKSIPSGDAV